MWLSSPTTFLRTSRKRLPYNNYDRIKLQYSIKITEFNLICLYSKMSQLQRSFSKREISYGNFGIIGQGIEQLLCISIFDCYKLTSDGSFIFGSSSGKLWRRHPKLNHYNCCIAKVILKKQMIFSKILRFPRQNWNGIQSTGVFLIQNKLQVWRSSPAIQLSISPLSAAWIVLLKYKVKN